MKKNRTITTLFGIAGVCLLAAGLIGGSWLSTIGGACFIAAAIINGTTAKRKK